MRETAYEPVMVTLGGPDDYPRFLARKAGSRGQVLPDLPLAPGDGILAVGDVDLGGAACGRVIAAFARHQGAGAAHPGAVRSGRAAAPHDVVAGSYRAFWPRHLASLAFIVCALFLAFRARPTRLVDAIVWIDLVAAIFFACTFAGGTVESALALVVHVASLALAAPLALRAALLFPHGQPPRSQLARYGPWTFASLGLFDADALLRRAVLAPGRRARQRRGRPRLRRDHRRRERAHLPRRRCARAPADALDDPRRLCHRRPVRARGRADRVRPALRQPARRRHQQLRRAAIAVAIALVRSNP